MVKRRGEQGDSAVPDMRAGFAFRGGHIALDLPATLRGRLKPKQSDLLQSPADLARWMNAAGATQAPVIVTEAELKMARKLREAIYELALARIGGVVALPARARAALNAFAAAPPAVVQLDGGGNARWSGGASALLASVGREAIQLIGGKDSERIRQCEGEICAHLFLDSSRAGDRRWCSMAACGNRAKVAQFRKRKRAE